MRAAGLPLVKVGRPTVEALKSAVLHCYWVRGFIAGPQGALGLTFCLLDFTRKRT